MVNNSRPTRAEVNDVINTLLDGADGLVLAAETAIGKNPVGCVSMIQSLIHKHNQYENSGESLSAANSSSASRLIAPHGGKLIDRIID